MVPSRGIRNGMPLDLYNARWCSSPRARVKGNERRINAVGGGGDVMILL